jgi:hypothetical protein
VGWRNYLGWHLLSISISILAILLMLVYLPLHVHISCPFSLLSSCLSDHTKVWLWLNQDIELCSLHLLIFFSFQRHYRTKKKYKHELSNFVGLSGITHLDLFGARVTDLGTNYLKCRYLRAKKKINCYKTFFHFTDFIVCFTFLGQILRNSNHWSCVGGF